jgi:toxin ParE1/3/4
MDFQVKISPVALRELAEITEYISVDDPMAVAAFVESLLSAAASLHRFPNRHGKVRRKSQRGLTYRKAALESYLIYYHVNDKSRVVTVLHFWHSARQPPHF